QWMEDGRIRTSILLGRQQVHRTVLACAAECRPRPGETEFHLVGGIQDGGRAARFCPRIEGCQSARSRRRSAHAQAFTEVRFPASIEMSHHSMQESLPIAT